MMIILRCSIDSSVELHEGSHLSLKFSNDFILNEGTLLIYYALAEVPSAARINMQPAEHLCTSGFRVSGPPGPGVGGGRGQTCIKTFLRQVGMCVQNFIKIGAGVWISICPTHSNRRTNRQTSLRPFIYI